MQTDWRWCRKCQGLAFSLNQPSVCPAGGSHDHSQSGNYALALDDPSAPGQSEWRWCKKCQGLAFSLNQPSVCPAGGSHDHSQSGNYTLPHNDPSAPGQSEWRWCRKCQGLAFSLNQPSVCPAGGSHDHSGSGNYMLAFAQHVAQQPAVEISLPGTGTIKPAQRLTFPDMSALLPSGASLFYMAGDISLSNDFAAGGKTVFFYWNVSKVPNAQGALWQVNQVPFGPFKLGEDPKALQNAVSGKGSGAQGKFSVDFAKIPRRPLRTGVNEPLWYIRVLPLGSSGTVIGQPSNVIRVYDKIAPSSGPQFEIDMGKWYVKPGIPIRITQFESVPYRFVDEWPPGCEYYKGAGYHETPWSWAAGAVEDALDWTSKAYEDAKNYVVTGVVTIFPFVPRKLAEVALDAALASCGIPPSIPNLNQMLTSGSDYLAGQMVNEIAKQAPGSEFAVEVGKEELRRRAQEKAAHAIEDAAHKIVEPGADSKWCVGKEYPPILKITVQNVGAQTYTDVEIKLRYTDFSVPSQPGLEPWLLVPLREWLLRPFQPLHIAQIAPGQSLIIPVDIFSHMNVAAVPQDRNVSYSMQDIGHWMRLYRLGQFSFTVDGGRTLKYQARQEGGPPYNEQFVDDGMGFSFKSPKRPWMDEPFVWSPG